MPQSMGFLAMDQGGSLEVQSYYGEMLARYWLSIHAGCLASAAATVAGFKGGITCEF